MKRAVLVLVLVSALSGWAHGEEGPRQGYRPPTYLKVHSSGEKKSDIAIILEALIKDRLHDLGAVLSDGKSECLSVWILVGEENRNGYAPVAAHVSWQVPIKGNCCGPIGNDTKKVFLEFMAVEMVCRQTAVDYVDNYVWAMVSPKVNGAQ